MAEQTKVHKRRVLDGKVEKLSTLNTIKVRVESKYPHPKYGKIIKKHVSYLVHNDGQHGEVAVGYEVKIQECPPVSKNKKWELITITKKN
jgi:small subunit ribosomal protein S17